MTEKTINFIKLPDGETYKIGGSGSGFNLFDTKISDHVLEGEEAIGWALQGTYVYKEGVAGSRFGYPNFYAKCLEEYTESTEIFGLPWTQPVLTSNGSVGGNTFAVEASSEHSSRQAYKSFDGNTTTKWGINNANTGWLTFYNPTPLKVSSIVYTPATDYPAEDGATLEVLACNDNSSWVSIWNGSYVGNSIQTLNIQSPNFYKYYRIALSNTTTVWAGLGELTINAVQDIGLKRHSNKHIFYELSNKDKVDSIYANTGKAWYFGIDLANERIFLPRNDYFFQLTGDTSQVGESVEAGLPDIDFSFVTYNSASSVRNVADNMTIEQYSSGSYSTSAGTGYADRYSYDASSVNPTYGNSDTVQPNAVKQLLYICVGNTKVESAVSNVTEITTSENDTLPLFHNFYSQEDMTTTGAYANASLGAWLSGNVYTTAYEELVKKLGTDNVKANTDEYTDYDFVVNQDDLTFRLPLKNGQEVEQTNIPDLSTRQKLTGDVHNYAEDDLYLLFAHNSNIGGGEACVGMRKNTTDDWVYYRLNHGNVSCTHAATVIIPKGYYYYVGIGGLEYAYRFNFVKRDLGNLYYKVANTVQNLELLDAVEVINAVNDKAKISEITKIALSNIQTTDESKVGYVYSTGYAASQVNVYAPVGGKWLILNLLSVNASSAVIYQYGDDVQKQHYVGEIVDGGTLVLGARSGYQSLVTLLRIA